MNEKKTKKLCRNGFFFCIFVNSQEKTMVKLYAVVKEKTQAHIVCFLPCGSEIGESYSPQKSSVLNKFAKL